MNVSLVEAMGRMEGWYDPRSRCVRNNNPGNIEWGKFARAHGATGTDGRFAIFPKPELGFGCMTALLQSGSYAGLTVAEALGRWAPTNENDTGRYIANVCSWAGCSPTDAVAPLLAAPLGLKPHLSTDQKLVGSA